MTDATGYIQAAVEEEEGEGTYKRMWHYCWNQMAAMEK